jgi:hypothetical protein
MIRIVIAFLMLLFSTPYVYGANYSLEIIQPQPSLNTNNRFYRAYPGILYNVRAGVIGGAYPYTYSLTTFPSGMTINRTTGEISWSNPTTSGSPHSVTLSVTDTENTTVTRSWTITVTTTGFLFIDAVDGLSVAGGGTGTLANPWKTLNDFYLSSKNDTTYSNNFLYFMAGTYLIDTPTEDEGRVPFVANYKPVVWLAYPGESPVIDFQDISDRSIIFYSGNSNIYIDGIEFKNMLSYGIQMDSNQDNMVYRRIKMHDLGFSAGCNNQSFFRVMAAGQGDNLMIQDSELYSLNHGTAIKLYQNNKFLIEDNSIHDITDTSGDGCYSQEGIALKQDITSGTVRHNQIEDAGYHAIGGNMNSQTWTTENNEILFNRLWGDSQISLNQNGNAGLTYVYRNTVEAQIDILALYPANTAYLTNNVIQAASPQITGTTTNIIDTDNLKGTTGIIDGSGFLLGSYRTTYLGITGWETGESTAILTGGTIIGGTLVHP